jgi:outer membrane protein assembly factor BamB
VRAGVLALFPTTVFNGGFGYNQRPFLALNDGSAMVTASSGTLFRIDAQNRVTLLWKAPRYDYYINNGIELLAPFGESGVVLYVAKWMLGVRADGTVAFRKQVDFADGNSAGDVTAAQDREGTVWFARVHGDNKTVYAYVPRTRRVEEVPNDVAQGDLVAASDGRVYQNTRDGLFELKSLPRFHRKLAHPPIRLSPGDEVLDIRAVGSDGSLWASTWTGVIHVHPDGRVHKIVLSPPIMVSSGLSRSFDLTIARDGAVWIKGSKLIRIANDDRVAVIDLANYDAWTRGPSFGPDNTPWTTVSGENPGIAHFTIGPSHQAPLVVTTKAQPLPNHILVVAPNVPPPTDIGIRREMLVFAPLLGDPWHCTANAPAIPGFPAYPKTFAITFAPFMGNTLTRVMTGDRFFIRTLYSSNVPSTAPMAGRLFMPTPTAGPAFYAYTNEGGGLAYAGGDETLYSSDGLSFGGENREKGGRVIPVTERYIRPSATRLAIAIAFDYGGRHEGTISCKRTPIPDVPALYEP